MTHRFLIRLAGTFFAFMLCALPVAAQVSAILSGTVTDQSGAVVSAAGISAKDVDTGATRTTATDGAGRIAYRRSRWDSMNCECGSKAFRKRSARASGWWWGRRPLSISDCASAIQPANHGECRRSGGGRDHGGHFWLGGPAAAEGSSSERAQLRSAVDSEPGRGELYFAESRRDRCFKFNNWQ